MDARLAIAACLAAAAAGAQAAPPGSPWGAGHFPDVPLVAQDGRTFRFYDDLVKDRFVVINFVFTRCKAACPMETANLARVQKLLASRIGRDVFMYSISLDPDHDTPAVMNEYAARFRAGPGWLFLTGQRADIERVRASLGDRSAWQNHAVGLWLGNDPAGQWTSLSAVDNPGFVAMSIDEWMRTKDMAHAPVTSYAEAPRIRLSPGEDLFRTRCAACHTVGGGDRIGPDLAGVTGRRDRDWLARWIADPQALIDAGDHVARDVFRAYQQRPMPALRASPQQMDELLSYIEARSHPAR
ncbi:MAG TPA: SCO family protein [Anaeromyxobacteraceae bacterium]|nr:SCO family protein [Anaeromyxobacteraceae bacterium]